MTDEAKPMQYFHNGDASFNLDLLHKALEVLNQEGQVAIVGVAPGSVDLFEVGAHLAFRAQEIMEHGK